MPGRPYDDQSTIPISFPSTPPIGHDAFPGEAVNADRSVFREAYTNRPRGPA